MKSSRADPAFSLPTPPYFDRDAIDYLARCVDQEDAGASAHWREMHGTFRYIDGELTGLRGFGTYTDRSHWARNLAHRALQQPWRRMGRGFPDFARIEEIAHTVARRQDRVYDLDVLRQALTMAYLQSHLPAALTAGRIVVVIGDGYGTLSSILLMANPGIRVVAVNLVKTLLVDLVFVAKVLPHARQALVTDSASLATAIADCDTQMIALRADDSALLRAVPASLAINIASMQEMTPATIAGYFEALRSTPGPLAFYCCNREAKVLPDGVVVKFSEYPWRADDRVMDDALCPWHQQYYSARLPFVRSYDGPIRHRLALLAHERGASAAESMAERDR